MERNVLLVTDDLILEKTIKNYFVSKNNYNIISANDEVDITAKLSVNPEFLLIDKSDFLVVERLLIKVKFNTVVIMLTDKNSYKVFSKVDYYIEKPFNEASFFSLLESIDKKVLPLKQYPLIDTRISNIFILLGIPVNTIGYRMLKTAVKLTVNNPLLTTTISKNLYPLVAEDFATTANKVERDIRHSITVAFNKGTIFNIEKLFGMAVFIKGEKPTNSEFISIVAEKIRLEGY